MDVHVTGWSMRRQVWTVFALFMLTGISVVVLDEIGQRRSRQALQLVRDDPLRELRTIKFISDAYGLDLVDTTARVHSGLITPQQGLAVVSQARDRADRQWQELSAMPRGADEDVLFRE